MTVETSAFHFETPPYAGFRRERGPLVPTNIGFDDGHPYVEDGADDGELSIVNDRVSVTRVAARAVAFTLERSVDAGGTWEPVLAETISGNGANLVDWESLSYGDTLYRAVAFTVEGATAEATFTVEARSEALWLSGGSAFGVTGRLPFDPSVQVKAGRERTLKQYAGRSLPVAYTGEALSRVVSVSGSAMQRSDETATVDHLTLIAQLEDDTFLFRDPDGRRIYGVIGEMNLPRQVATVDEDGFNAYWGYSFQLTETEPK